MTGSTHHRLSSRTVWDGPCHAWRNTSTWQTFLPNILAGSPERLWRRATSSVYLDHTAARVLVTVCLLLSALILSPSVPPLSTSITQYWDEYNDADTHRHTQTHSQFQTHRQALRKGKALRRRRIFDPSKAFQDVRGQVFGQGENVKWVLHKTMKTQVTEYLWKGEQSNNTHPRGSSEKQNVFTMNKKTST